MPAADIEAREPEPATTADRIIDAARHATHFAHEAHLAKSIAQDAIEEGAYAVKRARTAVRRGVRTLEDLRDDAAYYVKRQPFLAVGAAAAAGVLVGAAVGWIGGRLGQRQR